MATKSEEKLQPVPPAVEPKVFQIGEQQLITLFQALGQLPHTQVDPIINFLKRSLTEVKEDAKDDIRELKGLNRGKEKDFITN